MQLGDNFWLENLKVSSNDSNSLICHFSMEEIKDVVMNMKKNSAPGPNGFNMSFFKHFRDTIKGDLWKMFQDFWDDHLDIKRLNFGVITLVPTLKEANTIK
jgi:hypothetical protein